MPTQNILQRILLRKAEEVSARKLKNPELELQAQVAASPPVRGFGRAVKQRINLGKPAVIAEIKKASPSKGVIRPHFDPVEIAKAYEQAGATCISVLTEANFFQGEDAHILRVREVCSLPILRKDFIIEPYQIYESRVLGADCILIIVSALSDLQMQELVGIAQAIDLDVLVEVHNREELERGLMLRTPLLGINNRNLHDFTTKLETTIDLLPDVLYDRIIITESGIHTAEQVEYMRRHNVHGFLIGEVFMRAEDPGEALRALFPG